ncbi:hypothetical protein PISL3812_05145 [Talaromyces islandicus]|uniref:Uncharacterized protein n=1 Tax=Talaromyces islandicus TaxID=28573 RepID=A0A0U1LXM5_TALIS|nr:hypothetical protein PISL3812_05145 [Talaromyces islandicus]
MISRSKGKEDESGQKASEQHRSLSDLSKTDFPRNFGKSVFDCNFFKAMSDLDMMNYDIDEVEIIKELEIIRNIPQPSRDGDDQVHNPGLYTWISHVYRLRDTNEKKEVERTLLSDISTIFQRLRQSAAELSAENAGRNGVIASVSIDSPPSSERTISSTTNLEPTSPTQDRMMAKASLDALAQAKHTAVGFAEDHPVYATLIALGILAILMPWALEILGFGDLSPIEGSFAALWQSSFLKLHSKIFFDPAAAFKLGLEFSFPKFAFSEPLTQVFDLISEILIDLFVALYELHFSCLETAYLLA